MAKELKLITDITEELDYMYQSLRSAHFEVSVKRPLDKVAVELESAIGRLGTIRRALFLLQMELRSVAQPPES